MRSNPLIDLVYQGLSGNTAVKVSENIRNLRLAKCRSCYTDDGKKTVLPTGNCRICTCFVDLKTEFLDEHCPVGKW